MTLIAMRTDQNANQFLSGRRIVVCDTFDIPIMVPETLRFREQSTKTNRRVLIINELISLGNIRGGVHRKPYTICLGSEAIDWKASFIGVEDEFERTHYLLYNI